MTKIAGIILAGGKGTRAKSKDKNKVTLPFLNKPLIIYAVELMSGIVDPVIVVVGAFADSIKKVLKGYEVIYAHQKKRLGTGHATKVGLCRLSKRPAPEAVLVGYGDHTMFYKKETVSELIRLHRKNKAVLSLITTRYDHPEKLRWGRIVRDEKNEIIDNVEDKDISEKQRTINELNAGFYCIDFDFLKQNISKIVKSPKSGEYYINYLVKIAVAQNKKIVGLEVPFDNVGIGINTTDELKESEKIYQKTNGF
ncbi:NTP transferase domain-containing protein [Candidatus Roizmanbacteria bacterium]|jgi:bifunctional UDP-N-acetylglucosamine pyrophosphorylase/glucosamine-1-phosphate N-acetyltransferase|nr:NTP transferase domain-containing protein [Candidatus Roizmanbacteria bacterium]